MKAGFLFLTAAAVLAIILKYRLDARRDRTAVMARLAQEGATTGVTSPTEELFRSVGAPVPEEMRGGLATAAPPPRTVPRLGDVIGAVSKRPSTQAAPPPPQPLPTVVPQAPGGAAELATIFAGVRMPCDLAPLTATGTAAGSGSALFATSMGYAAGLTDALSSSFEQIGCVVTWVDDTTAVVRRGADCAAVTIHLDADRVTDENGVAAFPTAGAGQLVVKLTAT